TARLANGRQAVMPRLVKSIGGQEQPPAGSVTNLPYDPEMLAVLREGMNRVTDVGGTGFRNSQLGLGAVRMAGKTGTAQARNYGAGSRKGAGRPWAQKDHNLFIAYAPIDNPRYAVSVIVQHGGMGGGTAGAPRAREVMKVALLKDPEIRARIEQSGFTETEDPGAHAANELGAAAPAGAEAEAARPTPPRTDPPQ
ncbi:MAG TPA: penicillin-binding transpeptidase domain-containing protein, partial [Brevundimonas sp.]|nr:penicillin-binding transpeptidase domain-containing protein [Brevundimonas sp.]